VVSDLEQPGQQEKKRGERALNQVLYLQLKVKGREKNKE